MAHKYQCDSGLEINSVHHDNMAKPREHYFKWNKPCTERWTQQDAEKEWMKSHLYMEPIKVDLTKRKECSSGCQGISDQRYM